jgi:hypothetical protein
MTTTSPHLRKLDPQANNKDLATVNEQWNSTIGVYMRF